MDLSRRDFLRQSAIGAALVSFGVLTSKANAQPKSKIALVGTGAQGTNLLRQLTTVPGADIVMICDDYAPHLENGRKIAPAAKAVSDFRAVLDDSSIEGVVIATPLHLHAQMTIAALRSGKHALCEKMMAKTVQDAKAMAAAAASTGKTLMIGHQRRHNPIYQKARNGVKADAVGRVTHLRAVWHRNGSWRRSVPDASLERRLNWRLYDEYSGGLMAELGSHQIDIFNWFLGSAPTAVVGFGGVDYWQDGREAFDNVSCVFEYPNGVRALYSSITSNAHDSYSEWVFGDKGSVGFIEESKGYLFREAKAEQLTWLDAAQREKVGGREAIVVEGGPTKRSDAKPEELAYGENRNAYWLELAQFIRCIQQGEKPLVPASEALKACVAALRANEAITTRSRVEIPRSDWTV